MKIIFRAFCVILTLALVLIALPFALKASAPEYRDALGDTSHDQKIQGLYLLKESAKQTDNVIIYGSSELRTDYISTHPANFFKNKRAGFQVNLVGRGSCQSIIHAMSIAASGNSLENSPVVLITSPQSYVKDGITPDMFFANFSKQQYVTLMYDPDITDDIKVRFSKRVVQMFGRYDSAFGKLSGYDDIRILADIGSDETLVSDIAKIGTAPYFLFSKYLSDNKDVVKSIQLLNPVDEIEDKKENIDYKTELKNALNTAKTETNNNEFGMRNADYKKNVGNHLARFENRDKDLSYTDSIEYDDLKLLLDICELKGVKPLFVSVPLHGKWSDYTGFSKEKRAEYYEKVEKIVSHYNAEFLDLSGYEYDEYFLCDTMHLGWKGWLVVNEEIDKFYNKHIS